jgi:hypothetical protein
MPLMPLFFRKAVLESRLGAALRSGGASGRRRANGRPDEHAAVPAALASTPPYMASGCRLPRRPAFAPTPSSASERTKVSDFCKTSDVTV